MPERCTCGATLPEDALFCHKCGKPQRELLAVEPEPEEALPPPIPQTPAAPPLILPTQIGFRNRTAVMIALVAGFLSIMVLGVGIMVTPAIAPAWLLLTGMSSAFLYKMSTGQKLSTIAGARLGWITGIFAFVIVLGLSVLLLAAMKDPGFQSNLRDQMSHMGQTTADFDKTMESLKHPSSVLLGLPQAFLLLTVLNAFGGAIGARLLNRD